MIDGIYRSHLSVEAVSFIVGSPKRKQKMLLNLVDRIAEAPFGIGDYQIIDSVGRPLENVTIGGHVFSYWVDHGSREVRIMQIVKV